MKLSIRFSWSVFAFLISSVSAHAFLPNAKMPVCLHGPDELVVDNEKVIAWKNGTENQFKSRGFVTGRLEGEIRSEGDHFKFIIRIGPRPKDTLEVVYNKDFGSLPPITSETEITVCGDYITSFARGGGYDASPAGALIHWVHYNPGTRNSSRLHEHGFIMFDSNLAGFDDAPDVAWTGKVVRRN